MSFPSDLEIARSVTPRPIVDVAHDLGLRDEEIEPYGHTKAKVTLAAIERLETERPRGKYVVVTAITPTPLGEGKSTTTVGLAQGLNKIGRKAAVCIRQPSLGPVFGIKGGAAGGGYSQVIPMADFNLHLTGDVHAIGAAHNLAAAFVDNHLHHGNALGIDQHGILWPRVVDISDRAVRKVIVGLGGKENGFPRETEFVITVASEVMAVLALARDIHDLRSRLGRIVLATRKDGSAVTADDLRVAGAMTALLTDAIKPNLLQTLEGGPAFVHCGPFANIAHGNNSIIADRLALATNEIVCTEAGFGADMGVEKFFDIKCRASGLAPDAAVVVATIRALKMHGGVGKIVAGKPLDPALLEENVDAVRAGAANLAKQIENVRLFGVPAVVAINSFPTDTPAEVEAVREVALEAGARDAVVATHFVDGGAGAAALAEAVWAAAGEGNSEFRLLYPDDMALADKIEAIATRIYGADGVEYLP
ncbi:MAG TPA: formate--tetrahydrofolate ligase, partial [Candidatus Limnocylindrales bacterium]|nr:formate--tetrahydrofolate ligase [Candidatus Limnocylindrales bacterium]